MPDKIDSNIVGLSYAEEASLGVAPGSPVWYPLDPNEYDDFGGEIETVARNPINASRQRRKGVVTDLDASGGFQQDLTQSNLTRIMQGFFFADAHERVSNTPLNGAAASTMALTDFVATGSKINVNDGTDYQVGDLLRSSGFTIAANNIDVMMVTAITVNELTVDATLVDETWTVGTLEKVGFQHGTTDLSITLSANVLTIDSVIGFASQAYQVGEWIFIGGDLPAEKFTLGGSGQNAPGYARIEAVAANKLTLKEPTFTPLTDAGTDDTIRIFHGKYLRNEKTPSLIKRRSYQIERTLGDDGSGVQSEVLVGSVSNEFTLNLESADKVTCGLSFVATDNEVRDGSTGIKSGNRDAVITTEDAFNTSSDVYQQRLFVHGAAPTPASLFAFVTSGNITINNNANGLKAISVLGSFEVSLGDFEVTGEIEVYFASVAAVTAVKANSDVGFNTILASNNAGIVFDIPLLSLGGGRVTVEKDEPIMLPLEKMAAENDNGYTMSATYFNYLPTAAMPS